MKLFDNLTCERLVFYTIININMITMMYVDGKVKNKLIDEIVMFYNDNLI